MAWSPRVLALPLISCFAGTLAALGPGTPQQPTFRTGVDLVAVDVRVVDGASHPVPGLGPSDFVVTVDGTPRTVATTDFLNYPVTAGGSRLSPNPSAPIAARPFSSNDVARTPGRTVILFVDEENIRAGYGKWVADATAGFVDRLPPDDRVGLIIPKSPTRISPTTDHLAVKAALTRVVGHMASVAFADGMGPAAAFDRHYANAGKGPDPVAEQIVADVHERALGTLSSLMTLLESLRAEPGPKTVVLVAEELPVSDHLEEVARFNAEFSRLGEAAAGAQTTLYALQLDRPLGDVTDGRTASGEQQSAPARDRDMRSFGLETAASITGGKRLVVSGRPDGPFERVALEMSGQYLLGVRTEVADRDGKPHRITVTVKRSGVEVRARQVFTYTPASTVNDKGASDAVSRILRAVTVESGIPISVAAYSLVEPGVAGQVRVLLTAEIDRGATQETPMTVGYAITDAGGRNAGASLEQVTLQPAIGHPRGALVYLVAALVPPGRYSVRLAAADSSLRVGSVVHQFEARTSEVGPMRLGDFVIFDRYPVEPGKGRPSVSASVTDVLSGYVEASVDQLSAKELPALSARLEIAESAGALARVAGEMTVQGPDANGRLRAAGSVETGGLPAGDYLARAVFVSGGINLGQTCRPIRVVADAGVPTAPTAAPPPTPSSRVSTTAASAGAAAPLDAAPNKGKTGEVVNVAATPAGTVRFPVLVDGFERDLKILDRRQLGPQERQQYDQARDFVQRARRSEGDAQQLALLRTHSAATAPLVRRQLKLDELMSLAEMYRTGKTSAAIQTLSDSVASHLEVPLRYLEENRQRFGVEATPLADVNPRSLAAMCLLETEVAFLGGEEALSRLALARRLLKLCGVGHLAPGFAQAWYVAVAGYLQGEFRLADLMLHIEDGVRQFPSDAGVLVTAGMFYELLASPALELPAPPVKRRADPSGLTMTSAFPTGAEDQYSRLSAARQTGFAQAEDFYRRALLGDGRDAEAHLRLGRVLYLTGRSEAALGELRTAAQSPKLRVRYLASLFEARMHESTGRMDLAGECYRESIRACPNCLTAGVALSHIQRLSGQTEEAARTLDSALQHDAKSERSDFWWDYPLGSFWQASTLISTLGQRLR
jgi:VWFA-related protein